MNTVENIYVCLAAPLAIALLCARGVRQRMLLFFLGGMTACLLSSYISSFLAAVIGMDMTDAALEISPMVEETMKLFPLLFYLLVFEPQNEAAVGSMLMIAAGFATFENVCWMTENGASKLLIRGFGTGAMHIITGTLVAIGMLMLWDRLYLRAAGTVGLLCVAMVYHGIYNLLVSQTGAVAAVGYCLPLITTAVTLLFGRKILKRMAS